MKFNIHFSYADGTEDAILLEGDSIEEIRDQATDAMNVRGINESTCWSEELED